MNISFLWQKFKDSFLHERKKIKEVFVKKARNKEDVEICEPHLNLWAVIDVYGTVEYEKFDPHN